MVSDRQIEKWIAVFIGLIVLFKVLASLIPEGQTAGDELNASGVPLGSFFVSDGVIWLILIAGVVLLLIKQFKSARR